MRYTAAMLELRLLTAAFAEPFPTDLLALAQRVFGETTAPRSSPSSGSCAGSSSACRT